MIDDTVKAIKEEINDAPDSHSVVLSVGFVKALIAEHEAARGMEWVSVDKMPDKHKDRYLLFVDDQGEIKEGYHCLATGRNKTTLGMTFNPIGYIYPDFLFNLPLPPLPTGERE